MSSFARVAGETNPMTRDSRRDTRQAMRLRLEPDVLLRAGRQWSVQCFIGAILVLYLIYHLARFRLSDIWPLTLVGDAGLLFNLSLQTFARADYPDEVFPYPPSAVLLFSGLGLAGPAMFMLAWYALMVAGLIVSVRAALTQERPDLRDAWPLIGAIAVLLADSPITWDLRNTNSNLIALGLVMAGYGLAGRRPLLAGTLVGLSFSLKPYSGLLLVWLVVNGPRRMVYAGAAAVAALWIVVPVAVFGMSGVIALYGGWRDQVARLADPSFHALLATQTGGPPLVTVHKAIVNLTGQEFQSAVSLRWLWALHAAWTAAVLWYAWRCRNGLMAAIPSRAALADWTVLLLVPLPFSPWLEPYHAIPLLTGALLCTTIALDPQAGRRDRLTGLAALATLALFLAMKVPFPVRGLALLAEFLVVTIVLGMLRPRLARVPAPAERN